MKLDFLYLLPVLGLYECSFQPPCIDPLISLMPLKNPIPIPMLMSIVIMSPLQIPFVPLVKHYLFYSNIIFSLTTNHFLRMHAKHPIHPHRRIKINNCNLRHKIETPKRRLAMIPRRIISRSRWRPRRPCPKPLSKRQHHRSSDHNNGTICYIALHYWPLCQ